MSGKLRIVLGVLILAAAGSVIYLLPSVSPGSPGDRTAAAGDALTTNPCLTDSDHDGLNDCDEVYWRTDPKNPDTDGDGFLDGEEVLTGHNPLVKGPDDLLNPEQNATKHITGLVVGSIAAGDLDPSSPNYASSVKLLADAMATEYGRTVTAPRDNLNVVADSDENKVAYVRDISAALLKTILPATDATNNFFQQFRDIPIASRSWVTERPAEYALFTKEAHRLAGVMESSAQTVLAIPVPHLFQPQHAAMVQLLRSQQHYYETLAVYKDDPVLGSAALSGLLRVEYDGVRQMMYDFTIALRTKLK